MRTSKELPHKILYVVWVYVWFEHNIYPSPNAINNQLLLHSAKCILLITKKDKAALSRTLCLQDGNILIELQVTLGRTKKLTSSYLVMAQTCPRPTCSHNLLNACKSSHLCEMSLFFWLKCMLDKENCDNLK